MKATFTSSIGFEALGLDALGLDDTTLGALVADLWQVPTATVLRSAAEPVDYPFPSILTGARTWVRGTADAGSGPREFAFFVKRVHHWRHSPAFALVPPEVAAWAADSLPWRAEVLVYRSDLADRLPAGLTMPRAVRVLEREDETATLWLEAVAHDDLPWGAPDHARAAGLLGRLAGSSRVAPLADLDPQPWDVHRFVRGRIGHTVLPGLGSEATWRHPLVLEHFGDLRSRLEAVAERLDPLADEFARMRHRASHGDASPNNLLRRRGDDGFTLIDYGFWRPQPVGFDLSQLLVGDIQLGRQDADDLPERAAACVAAYTAGLAAEGLDVVIEEVRRGHAVSLVLFNGIASLPHEAMDQHDALEAEGRLTAEERERLGRWAARRAGIAQYSLDVLERTDH